MPSRLLFILFISVFLASLATFGHSVRAQTAEKQEKPKTAKIVTAKDLADKAHQLRKEAFLLWRLRRPQDAVPLMRQYLKITEVLSAGNNAKIAEAMTDLAVVLLDAGQHPEAERMLVTAISKFKQDKGKDKTGLISAMNSLATLMSDFGRFDKAEDLYAEAIGLSEQSASPDMEVYAPILNNYAQLNMKKGNFAKAEQLLKKSIKIKQKQPPIVSRIWLTLTALAGVYHEAKRYQEMLKVIDHALDIIKKTMGDKKPDYALGLINRANARMALNDMRGAEADLLESYQINLKYLPDDHPLLIKNINNLAYLYLNNQRVGEAEPLLRLAFEKTRKKFGETSLALLPQLQNLAELEFKAGRHASAKTLFEKAKNMQIKHDQVPLISLNGLARVAASKNDWKTAAPHWRQVTQILTSRAANGYADRSLSITNSRTKVRDNQEIYENFIKALLAEKNPPLASIHESFMIAQLATASRTSVALQEMSLRQSAGNRLLNKLIREHQDLIAEWRKLDEGQITLVDLGANTDPKVKQEKHRLFEVELKLQEISAQISQQFPDYYQLRFPQPVSLRQAKTLLSDDEALILFFHSDQFKNLPEETFIWVVTKEDVTWVRSPLGTFSLNKRIKRLRCGLDMAGWEKSNNKKAPCELVTGRSFDLAEYYRGKAGLPFEPEVANELYEGLFGQIKNKIKGKKLILVPSGPLTSLPFQVLLKKKPLKGRNYQNMAWLIKSHALSVLPSVSSLKALRRNAKASNAQNPYIGFGNPLLVGRDGKDKSAWAKQACTSNLAAKTLRFAGLTVPDVISKFFRGGQVDVDLLKRQIPLPETADELCAVAKMLEANQEAVSLGGKATETEVKRLSGLGVLEQAKIIHFATHGLLADETKALLNNKAEPALLLTPPEKATDQDDGLLTASEITQLKLDADWVILSACNTASGDKPGAEPMSGLAKAFFYAGARALLISHWSVNSEPTVALITKSFKAQQNNPSIGRAGALRAAMLELIKSKRLSHPEYWAPFIVVGEGNER